MRKIVFLLFVVICATYCQQVTDKSSSTDMPQTDSIHPRSFSTPEYVRDGIIYEVNIRQYTPEGTFDAFQKHLPRLHELGVKVLWLMPIHPIGEVNRKGSLGSYYAVRDYYGINPEFGTKEDFQELVDKVHELGMYLIIDWVPNHTAWDNPLTEEKPDFYLKDLNGDFVPPVGTDWDDVIALDYSNPDLRQYMKEAMLYWVEEFDIDGYRCDVAGYVPTDFWREVRYELDQRKEVFMLAEWEERVMHQAFDMSYAWELEETMRKVVESDNGGAIIYNYLAKMYNVWSLDQIKMNHTTNHDKNSWEGTVFERFGKAAETFAVLTYLVEGMPLIYSGQEVGLSRPLAFFEKDSIAWGDHPFNALYARLGKLKADNPALWSGKWGGRLQLATTTEHESVLAFRRQKDENEIVAFFNLTDQRIDFSVEKGIREGEYKSFVSKSRLSYESEQELSLGPWGYEIWIRN
jgi:1,4-alpha-glucan branching enzyme